MCENSAVNGAGDQATASRSQGNTAGRHKFGGENVAMRGRLTYRPRQKSCVRSEERSSPAATAALRIIFKQGHRYKKAGVTFLELVPTGRVQRGLFDQLDDARSISRMHAVDDLNARFGRGTIGFALIGAGYRSTNCRSCLKRNFPPGR